MIRLSKVESVAKSCEKVDVTLKRNTDTGASRLPFGLKLLVALTI